MDGLPEAIPSRSRGVRTGRDVGRPSKSRSDRTSVRAVNPAKAINVQTFFSCMGSPSAPGVAPRTQPERRRQEGLPSTPCKAGMFPRTMAPALIGALHQTRHPNLNEERDLVMQSEQ